MPCALVYWEGHGEVGLPRKQSGIRLDRSWGGALPLPHLWAGPGERMLTPSLGEPDRPGGSPQSADTGGLFTGFQFSWSGRDGG